MKHDQLLQLEANLKRQYLKLTNSRTRVSGFSRLFNRTDIEIEAKKHQQEQCDEAAPDKCNAHDFTPEHWIFEQKILAKMQENEYTKRFWSVFAKDGDPMLDVEEPSFYWVESIEDLKAAFMMYEAFRQVFIFKDLIFVNQTVGGGWEAWTLKQFRDELIPFESISMQLIIKEGTHDGLSFEQYIEKLQHLTRFQVIHYLDGQEEICNQCGKSVAFGSGRFVNRVPSFDNVQTRKDIGYPFPTGAFTCAECDSKERVQSQFDCPKGGKHNFEQFDCDPGDQTEYGLCSKCGCWIDTNTGENETKRFEQQQKG
jgi:hypothetical protein